MSLGAFFIYGPLGAKFGTLEGVPFFVFMEEVNKP